MSNNMIDQRREVARKIEPGVNDAYLVGTLERKPEYAYHERGYPVYEGMLAVPRLSGEIDHLPIICDEHLMNAYEVGANIALAGRLEHRDRAAYPDVKYRLVIKVEFVTQANLHKRNIVALSGHVCRNPIFRKTPKGRDLCELMVAVPRGTGRQDYIVCIAWNGTARYALTLAVGASVSVSGRFQSRDYIKRLPDGTEEKRMTHEVHIIRLS